MTKYGSAERELENEIMSEPAKPRTKNVREDLEFKPLNIRERNTVGTWELALWVTGASIMAVVFWLAFAGGEQLIKKALQ